MPNNAHAVLRRSIIYNSRHNGLECVLKSSFFQEILMKYSYEVLKFKKRLVNFMFSKKATKIEKIFTIDMTFTTKRQINSEDFCQFLWPS